MGLMIAGNPYNEEMVINHTNLFLPLNPHSTPPSHGNHIYDIRKILFNGEYKKASDFLVDISHADGFSENHPKNNKAQACINATMDIAVCRAFIRNLINISESHNIYKEKVQKWYDMLNALSHYGVNKDVENYVNGYGMDLMIITNTDMPHI